MITSPQACWVKWIEEIVVDPDVNRQKIIEHIKIHIKEHMPPTGASATRWAQWFAGTYNLLGMLQQLTAGVPSFELCLDRLFQYWVSNSNSSTPPPFELVDSIRIHIDERKIIDGKAKEAPITGS